MSVWATTGLAFEYPQATQAPLMACDHYLVVDREWREIAKFPRGTVLAIELVRAQKVGL